MSIYSRQIPLNVKVPETVSIVGCGGIGSWVGIFSALMGTKKFHLYDSDVLEASNLNRLPFKTEDIGKPKVLCLKEFITSIRPDSIVFTHPNIDEDSLMFLEPLVFICTDTIRSQAMISKFCKEQSIPFIRLGYDGRDFTLMINEEVRTWGEETGYRFIPSYVITPALLSLLALLLYDLRELKELSLTLSLNQLLQRIGL